jgi:hypothetical protein
MTATQLSIRRSVVSGFRDLRPAAKSKRTVSHNAKNRQFRALPESVSPAMARAEQDAVAMLGSFPVPADIPSLSIRASLYSSQPFTDEIRSLEQAQYAVHQLVDHFRSDVGWELEAPTAAELLRNFKSLKTFVGSTRAGLAALDRPTINYLSGPGHPLSKLPNKKALDAALREPTNLYWREFEGEAFNPLSFRQLFPTNWDPMMPDSIYPDGLLVHLLKKVEAYIEMLASDAHHDMLDDEKKRLPKGGNTNTARHRYPSPEWQLVVDAWKVFERCPNTAPNAKLAKSLSESSAPHKRQTSLYDFSLKVYEAATGIRSGEREALVHEFRLANKLLTQENILARRLNDLFLRGRGYDAADVWIAIGRMANPYAPQPTGKSPDPRRVPSAVVEEVKRIFSDLEKLGRTIGITGLVRTGARARVPA